MSSVALTGPISDLVLFRIFITDLKENIKQNVVLFTNNAYIG